MQKEESKLPPNAHLAFKGKIFEVWQWEQRMFDGSVEVFELVRRPDTVQVIAVVGDKILIQVQEQPDRPKSFLSLPGGRCDWGEDSLEAAKRELLEETGYASDDWLLWQKQRPVWKVIWTIHTYIARNCSYKESPQLDAGEKIENKLITFEDFLKLPENPLFRDIKLSELIRRISSNPVSRKEFHDLLFKN